MDPITLTGLGAGIAALMGASMWLGHHFGTLTTSVGQIEARATALRNAVWADIAHPVATVEAAGRAVEHATAAEAMTVATKAVEFILDDSGDDATIAAAKGRKLERAKMRTALAAKLVPEPAAT